VPSRATIDVAVVEERLPLYIIRPAQVQTRRYDSLSQQQSIKELSFSIRKHGLLQPIIVRPISQGFEIVAGHRRFYACKSLRWKAIPAMVKDLSDKDAFEIQLVENLQRNTLDPIEEAEAFKIYVTDYGWGGVTHLANTIMKSEQYVSGRLQLLKLPQSVIEKVKSGELKASHAVELLGLEYKSRETVAENVVSKNLSIKDIRRYKYQLLTAKDKEIVQYTTTNEEEHKPYVNSDVDPNDSTLLSLYNSRDQDQMLLHHKIVFLKKVQLSFKASLSRTDSLIHEYEESIAPKTERTGFNDNHHEADMNDYVDYIPKMLMQFRLGIHSMLDETIRSSSKLIREESNL
jgi:ParB family transcriptional regulator, chromosome partitioning protein